MATGNWTYGKLDLSVSNLGAGTVAILLGNGDGSFQPVVGYFVGGGPGSVTVADLNWGGETRSRRGESARA